jgi:CubicO group peptidase (beta-lactamase class C family)
MKRFLILILALIPCGRAGAQSPIAEHPRVKEATALLEKWIDAERAYKRIPGLSGAVVSDQEVIWKGGTGYANLERRAPALSNTLFSICSISKLFTSIALLQVRDKGLVKLDDPVAKHLPWFKIKRTDPAAGEITVEGILTHASGLPREAAYPYWSAPSFAFPTRDQIMATVDKEETLYPPERFFQYSNLGLTLAGEIVAAASGQPYGEYVQRNVLDPLGLKDTHPEMPAEERGRRLATGYGHWEREGERRTLPFFSAQGINPAAGYASTAEDLARFASWQLRLLASGGTEVLSANTLREMQRVHFVDPSWETTWGLGFSIWRDDDKTFVGHGGSCPGYQTQLAIQPDEKIAVVAMSNAIDVNAAGLARGEYAIMAPAIKAARADSNRSIKPMDPSLARYLGTYANAWRGETEVIAWEGGLAAASLPSDNPVRGLTKLKLVRDNVFRRVRPDGGLAEEWTFDLGEDGTAIRYTSNYNISPRIKR